MKKRVTVTRDNSETELNMKLRAHIQGLEERLLQQAVRLDGSLLETLLADDFVEFGASGKVWNKAQVIDDLKTETFVTRTLSDFDVRLLADNVVLATYLCSSGSSSEGADSISLRSSIWRKHLDDWHMVFHHGTRVSA
jgi:hypothetical protein